MEELNNYLIYFLILLCICLILFYLFYKLNNKVNIYIQKLDTLDKFLAGVLLKNVISKPEKSSEDQSHEENQPREENSGEENQPGEENSGEENQPGEENSGEENSHEDQPEDKPSEYIQNKEKFGKKTNLEKIKEDSD
jgi:hypothetical protein